MPVVAAIAVAAVAHFTYYINYSLTYRIAYILPFPVMLGAICAARAFGRRRRLPAEISIIVLFLGLFATLVPVSLMIARGPRMNPLLTCLGRALVRAAAGNTKPLADARDILRDGRWTNGDTGDNLALVRKYAGDRKRVALFIHKANNFDADLAAATGQTHVFPVNVFMEDELSTATREYIVSYPHGLRDGDFIFVNAKLDNRLMRDIVEKLRSQFDFETVETTKAGISAIRLRDRHTLLPPMARRRVRREARRSGRPGSPLRAGPPLPPPTATRRFALDMRAGSLIVMPLLREKVLAPALLNHRFPRKDIVGHACHG